MPPRICLATATTERFVPGTMVTVGSFLEHHPDYDGDVVVIEDGLPGKCRGRLRALFDRVRFLPVSSGLRDRIARLGAARPDFRRVLPRFFALEAFRLTGYRKLLFCDSDLLFQQPVTELFDAEDALLCCGDLAFLKGQRRDAATFAPLEDPALAGAAGALDRTFNDGFLLIDADLVEERHYAGLLALLAPGDLARHGHAPHQTAHSQPVLRRTADPDRIDVQLPACRGCAREGAGGPRPRRRQGAAFQHAGEAVDDGGDAGPGRTPAGACLSSRSKPGTTPTWTAWPAPTCARAGAWPRPPEGVGGGERPDGPRLPGRPPGEGDGPLRP